MKKKKKQLADTLAILDYSLSISDRHCSKANELLITLYNNKSIWDIAKMNRWIGYAHCLLVAEGSTTIKRLREDIRELLGNENKLEDLL